MAHPMLRSGCYSSCLERLRSCRRWLDSMGSHKGLLERAGSHGRLLELAGKLLECAGSHGRLLKLAGELLEHAGSDGRLLQIAGSSCTSWWQRGSAVPECAVAVVLPLRRLLPTMVVWKALVD
ncbi:hypothetical protein L3X38_019107 [Prunus dulcis]|uniref:Uncharacterized protein n=1 Tax=Prunus dulcis TaxID=3755 RepID=A0AAD4ZBD1_PRUDU|nr:hypothetical protein L3X38_019107 [Prunus dulcis]